MADSHSTLLNDKIENNFKYFSPEDFWKSYSYRQNALIYLDIDSDEYFLLNLLSSYNPCHPPFREIIKKTKWGFEKVSKKMLSLRNKKYITSYSPTEYTAKTGIDLNKVVRDDQLVYIVEYSFIRDIFLYNKSSASKIESDDTVLDPLRKSNRIPNKPKLNVSSASKIESDNSKKEADAPYTPLRKSNHKVLIRENKKTTTKSIDVDALGINRVSECSSSSSFSDIENQEDKEIGQLVTSDQATKTDSLLRWPLDYLRGEWGSENTRPDKSDIYIYSKPICSTIPITLESVVIPQALIDIGFSSSTLRQVERSAISLDELQSSLDSFAFDIQYNKLKETRQLVSPVAYFLAPIKKGIPYQRPSNYKTPEELESERLAAEHKEKERRRLALELSEKERQWEEENRSRPINRPNSVKDCRFILNPFTVARSATN